MDNIKKVDSFENNLKKLEEIVEKLESGEVDLENSVENWNYKKLNETNRISSYIKEQLKKKYDLS